jgi:hypothetical protein
MRPHVRSAFGFDFSPVAVEATRKRGLDADLLDLSGFQRAAPGSYRATDITAFHVLEHLQEPQDLFRFALTVAAPAARLWVAVPSDRRASRLYGEADALDSPPHHLTRWTARSLCEIGLRHGWQLDEHLYEPLSATAAIWEATRRHQAFPIFPQRWRKTERLARRALALTVWLRREHRRVAASGFSAVACYRLPVSA